MIQMFRWLLKPKFYSKCIYYVKCIKTRLEMMEKRRRAIQKFTKSDIVELLRRRLDYDAYKRTEWFLFEEKKLSCYEFIEKFIGCISDHLEDIIKQSDCPEECKEAIPSLMYATARLSDLPELRDLRTLFTEKYGNSLEPYINKEFVERLRRDPHTREMKIKLLYDIAQEFSIDWDAKALKLRLYAHPSLFEGRPNGSGGEHKDKSDFIKSKENEARHQNSSDDETTSTDTDTDRSSSHYHGRKASSSSFGSISEDDDDDEQVKEIKKPNSFWHIPPPYIKQQKTNNKGSESNGPNKTTDSQEKQKDIDSSEMKPTISVETTSSSKGNARMWGGGWHDYDDFIARFKAFTGRS
ncbi:uncharacterized protein LOC123921631 [Trifolium pratense]|nr:uncharacterized protein LOC123921631 [Trifolium pratense]